VQLADADSGEPAPGFAVELSAVAPDGSTVPATALDDLGVGMYRRRMDGAAGPWSLTVAARELPGGAPAVPLARTVLLTLDPARTTVVGGPVRPGRRGSAFPTVPVAAGVGVAVGLSRLARRRADPALSRRWRRSPSL
jgi:hypothetical protein